FALDSRHGGLPVGDTDLDEIPADATNVSGTGSGADTCTIRAACSPSSKANAARWSTVMDLWMPSTQSTASSWSTDHASRQRANCPLMPISVEADSASDNAKYPPPKRGASRTDQWAVIATGSSSRS